MATESKTVGKDEYNFIKMIELRLGVEVKKALTEKLIMDAMAEYEAKITPKIKEIVGNLSFRGVESFKDHVRLREELEIYLKWNDEPAAQITEKS